MISIAQQGLPVISSCLQCAGGRGAARCRHSPACLCAERKQGSGDRGPVPPASPGARSRAAGQSGAWHCCWGWQAEEEPEAQGGRGCSAGHDPFEGEFGATLCFLGCKVGCSGEASAEAEVALQEFERGINLCCVWRGDRLAASVVTGEIGGSPVPVLDCCPY